MDGGVEEVDGALLGGDMVAIGPGRRCGHHIGEGHQNAPVDGTNEVLLVGLHGQLRPGVSFGDLGHLRTDLRGHALPVTVVDELFVKMQIHIETS